MQRNKRLCAMLGLLLMLVGLACETARQGGLTGAAIGTAAGAGLGAIIGHQSGNAGEGALIGGLAGALIGGSIGYQIGKMNQDQTRSREELERNIAQSKSSAKRETLNRPTIIISDLQATPKYFSPPAKVNIEGTVQSYGKGLDSPPTGQMYLTSTSGNEIGSKPVDVEIADLGEIKFNTTVPIPPDAKPGKYIVTVSLDTPEGKPVKDTVSFNVEQTTAGLKISPDIGIFGTELFSYPDYLRGSKLVAFAPPF